MLEIAHYEDGHKKTTYFNPFLGYNDPIEWVKEHLDILASFYEHAPVDRGWILFEYVPSNMNEYYVIRKFLDLVEEIARNLNRSA